MFPGEVMLALRFVQWVFFVYQRYWGIKLQFLSSVLKSKKRFHWLYFFTVLSINRIIPFSSAVCVGYHIDAATKPLSRQSICPDIGSTLTPFDLRIKTCCNRFSVSSRAHGLMGSCFLGYFEPCLVFALRNLFSLDCCSIYYFPITIITSALHTEPWCKLHKHYTTITTTITTTIVIIIVYYSILIDPAYQVLPSDSHSFSGYSRAPGSAHHHWGNGYQIQLCPNAIKPRWT